MKLKWEPIRWKPILHYINDDIYLPNVYITYYEHDGRKIFVISNNSMAHMTENLEWIRKSHHQIEIKMDDDERKDFFSSCGFKSLEEAASVYERYLSIFLHPSKNKRTY